MQISVIIPTYKPQNYLWKCLDSLIKQDLSYDEFEIIIILNGPKDSYEESILKYISNVKVPLTFKYLYSPFGNVSNARNIGMDNASGKYYCFIDDDDYVSTSYLKEMFLLVDKDTIPLSNLIAFKDKTNEKIDYGITSTFKKCKNKKKSNIFSARSYFSVPVCKLIDREIVQNFRFNINHKNGEDGLFMFSISKNVKKVVFTSSKAIYYRRWRNNSAATRKRSLKKRCIDLMKLWKDYFLIWIKSPFDYNLVFFITRFLAGIKYLIINSLKK